MLLDVDAEDRAFKALGHRDRRAIMRVLVGGEHSVGDVAAITSLDQPIASQHLKILRTAELVTVRVDGNRRLYSVDFDRVGHLRHFLDQFWKNKLNALKRQAEDSTR